MFIEFFLVFICAALAALSFSKIPLGDWWYPQLSWKQVGILFGILLIVFEAVYFLVIR